jgi:hypothetical protein
MHLNCHTEFLTGTIYNWHHLLQNNNYKQIITDSFLWLVLENYYVNKSDTSFLPIAIGMGKRTDG